MEPKKNPKYDVHVYRALIFNFSLLISLGIVITAFQWMVREENIFERQTTLVHDPELFTVRATTHDKPAEPVKPEKIKNKVAPPNPTNFTTLLNNTTPETTEPRGVDQEAAIESFSLGSIEIPIDSSTYTFDRVEKMPMPVGGYPAFSALLSTKMKYPSRARRNGTQGKVYVVFTVNAKGETSDFAIEKGIGDGCDEEAIRVIKLSKWEPGKQRGRPVNVKMKQAITFFLQ